MARSDTAQGGAAITPSDNTTISYTFGLYVGGAGDLKVDLVAGGTVTFSNVPAGTVLPIQVSRIYSTGTTASNIIALY